MQRANVQREFVSRVSATGRVNPVGFNPCHGLYYTPAGTRPKTAFIATHYNIDFSEHYLGSLMAERGFGFLGWNTRYRGVEAFFLLEHALIDIASGVEWLRRDAGVENVIILGNSGGASLMGAYQSQAIKPNIQAAGGGALPQAVNELPKADLYIALQAHPGRPEVMTNWMDPSVIDETDPMSVDPALDMYNPDNGPPYSREFIEKYRAAQVARNDGITDWVLGELGRIRNAGGSDRVFNTYRVWADPRMVDATIEPSDRQANQCYLGDPKVANYGPFGIGSTSTLRTWLSMWSLRTSYCRGAPHLARITQPALVIQSTGDTGVFASDAQAIYDALASDDKTLRSCEGDHYLLSPANARREIADLIASWVSERVG